VWVTSKDGERRRRKKEKVLGPAAIPKHEALKKLAAYIETFTREKPAAGALLPFARPLGGSHGLRAGCPFSSRNPPVH
jgi:hypothetical protein